MKNELTDFNLRKKVDADTITSLQTNHYKETKYQ